MTVNVESIVDLDVDLRVRAMVKVQGQRWGQTSNVAVNVKGGVNVIVEDNVEGPGV